MKITTTFQNIGKKIPMRLPEWSKEVQLTFLPMGERTTEAFARLIHQERINAWMKGVFTDDPQMDEGYFVGFDSLNQTQREFYYQLIGQQCLATKVEGRPPMTPKGLAVLQRMDDKGHALGIGLYQPTQNDLTRSDWEPAKQ